MAGIWKIRLRPAVQEKHNAVRSHSGIENSLQWVQDVAMSEDDSRICKDHAGENMSLLRRMALKRNIQGKRLKAALGGGHF